MRKKAKRKWYVVTGGPCSGKTTAVKGLEKRGHRVQYEMARIYVDKKIAEGSTAKKERKDEGKFQKKILKLKVDLENKLPKDEIIFFDLGIPDSITYYEMAGLSPEDPYLVKVADDCSYKKIFLCDMYDYKNDYARIQSKEDAQKIHRLLEDSYSKLGYEIVKIPAIKNNEERIDLILKNL